MAHRHYRIRIYGQVQGVFFRASARNHADLLNLTGFARNEKDGSVYMEAEGEEENLRQFVEWSHRGPERARVDRVEVTEGALRYFTAFKVIRGVY